MCEICANVIFYAARSVAWPILTRNDLNGGSYGTTLIEQDRVRQQAGIAAWALPHRAAGRARPAGGIVHCY
jgi:hypothetical protein